MPPKIRLFNDDCMTAMRRMDDNQYQLAIVDPPYGLGDKLAIGGCKKPNRMQELYNTSKWVDVAPEPEYFKELFRVSENQIIWGANYFGLPPTRGFIVWDKVKFASNYSQAEFAWTSFDCVARLFRFCSNGGFVIAPIDFKIHPTQKPVALYQWLLKNYAKPGDKILDTHGGSCSIAIACDIMGYDCDIWEIDADYHKAAVERFERHKQQTVIEFG